eukprot:1158398-Pelagomonas_calceolata.AAC.11
MGTAEGAAAAAVMGAEAPPSNTAGLAEATAELAPADGAVAAAVPRGATEASKEVAAVAAVAESGRRMGLPNSTESSA